MSGTIKPEKYGLQPNPLRLDYIENDGTFTDIRYRNIDYDVEERPPYEPSHDTKEYKEWKLRERLFSEMVELREELGEIRKKK